MTEADNIRNGIIDKLLTISNEKYLNALALLVENSTFEKDNVKLTEEQILLMKLSDRDIENGKLISQSKLDKDDLTWLKEQ